MKPSLNARLVLAAIHLAAVFVLIATSVQYLDRPLRGDESGFAVQAREGVLANGAPVVHFDQTKRQPSPRYAAYGAYYGMWHPPLYLYALAAGVAIDRDADWAARGVGLVCLVLSLWVAWRIVRDQLGHETPCIVRALPLSLAVLSPLVMEGSLYIDIDNTVLATLLMVFLWQFLQPGDRLAPRRVLWLSGLFALALSAKITTPPIALLACAVFAAGQERPARNLAAVALVGVCGALLFAGAYLVYCSLLNYPPNFMFDMGFGGRKDLFATTKTLTAVLRATRWHVVWFSPILTMLLAGVTIARILAYGRTRRLEPVDLLVIFAVGTFAAYAVAGAMFGKYTVPAAFAGAGAIGILLAREWKTWDVPWWPIALAWAIVLAVGILWLPVPHLRLPGAVALASGISDPRNRAVAVILGVCAVIAWRWMRRVRGAVGTRFTAAGLSLALSLAVLTPIEESRVIFANADNGPLRAGVERGVRELIDYLNAQVPVEAAVLAPNDIGAYSNRRYFLLDDYAAIGPGAVEATARRPDVWCIVDSTMYPVVDPGVLARLGVARTVIIGTYAVYILLAH